MYFVAEAEVYAPPLVLVDKVVASVQRHMRLAYQPLTRRWRLNVASGPHHANSLGMTLGQSFDTLDEAMAAVRRLSGWKVADASVLDSRLHATRSKFRFAWTGAAAAAVPDRRVRPVRLDASPQAPPADQPRGRPVKPARARSPGGWCPAATSRARCAGRWAWAWRP
jgi:hypothetical protein